MQHRFQEGDVLFIPAAWLHSIATSPSADTGWWISLNRFVGDQHAVRSEEEENNLSGLAWGGIQMTGCKGETWVDSTLWPSPRPWVSH